MAPSSMDLTLDKVIQVVTQNRLLAYMWVGATTFAWYDTFASISAEKKYVWSSSWTVAKAVYLILRYDGLFILTYNTVVYCARPLTISCRVLFWVNAALGPGFICGICLNVIITLRIYALYMFDRKIKYLLICLNLCYFAVQVYTIIRSATPFQRAISINAGKQSFVICFSRPPLADVTLPARINILTISTVQFVLTLFSICRTWMDARRLGFEGKLTPLLRILLRDGIIYYLFATIVSIIATVLSFLVDGQLKLIYRPWQIAFHVFIGGHLVLGIRRAAHVYSIAQPTDIVLMAFETKSSRNANQNV